MSFFINKATGVAKSVQSTVTNTIPDSGGSKLSLGSIKGFIDEWTENVEPSHNHRYGSSTPVTQCNSVKFHVNGCAYFWAVSEALEKAEELIWILGYSSHHAKKALEALHPNISVFRWPDHYAGVKDTLSSTKTVLEGILKGGVSGLGKISDETLQTLFAAAGGPTLMWALHDKAIICDQIIAFLGGIDVAYGRWDTIQHPIADAHPNNLDDIVFPGQDYNNARVMDFANLDKWEKNKLSRLTTSRMGWQDVSLSLTGPSIKDLCQHFVDRWNHIHDMKYNSGQPKDAQYQRLPPIGDDSVLPLSKNDGISCQLVRSVTDWSTGKPLEHSIYNAYVDIIEKSEHFVYLEQQFFITATGNWLGTVWNRVGEAIVRRILRAVKEKKRYKVFVVMPAVPAFPGDLQALIQAVLPRSIMKLQRKSISRGTHSIMEKVQNAGVEPSEYMCFFNLRNYDRINTGAAMQKTEAASGVEYKLASQDHDDIVDPFGLREQKQMGEFEGDNPTMKHEAYNKYQKAASHDHNKWDTVSSCYMLGDKRIQDIPWQGDGKTNEIDAFVSEEVYVHAKVLIADDQIVLCGSANLNDRSLKGSRDGEIAMVIEDPTTVETTMDGRLFQASRFAAILRRYLFRQHLGLLEPQDMRKPDCHFHPVPGMNDYNFGDQFDHLVADPLSDKFLKLWNETVHDNALVFRKVFAPMPDNTVQTWLQYEALYIKRFVGSDGLHLAKYGHVAKENFPAGEEGVKMVKEELNNVRGTLVEMPLEFLVKSDIQVEGPGYNIVTRQGYV